MQNLHRLTRCILVSEKPRLEIQSYTIRLGVHWCSKILKEVQKTAPSDMVYKGVRK